MENGEWRIKINRTEKMLQQSFYPYKKPLLNEELRMKNEE
jgi:hypothetical protein